MSAVLLQPAPGTGAHDGVSRKVAFAGRRDVDIGAHRTVEERERLPMMSLRKIVAATDFSLPGNYAVSRAAHLAQEYRSSLALVHVMPEAGFEWLGTSVPGVSVDVFSAEKFAEAVLERLSDLARGIEKRHGVACELRLESGRPAERIAAIASGRRGSPGPRCARRTLDSSLVHGIHRAEAAEDEPVSNVAGQAGATRALRESSRSGGLVSKLVRRAEDRVYVAAVRRFARCTRIRTSVRGNDAVRRSGQNVIKQYRRKQSVALETELQKFVEAAEANGLSVDPTASSTDTRNP